METNKIQPCGAFATGDLSPRQDKMLEMLKDLHAAVTSDEVRSVNPILEKHGFSTMLSTIMKNMGIIEKDGTIRWSHPSEPTPDLAIRLERYYQLYPKIVQSKSEIQSYFESQDPFPVPLNKIWQLMEFEQYNNAKRSLLKNCEEGKDYVVLLKEAKSVENCQNDPEAEIFKLSRTGFQLFLLTAQKPMAKVFARLMIDMMNQRQEFYLKVNSGVSYLSEKANLMGDVEESIRYLQRFHKTLSEDVRAMCCDPGQLVLGFEKDATRISVLKAFDEAREIATRIFNVTSLDMNNPQIALK